MATELTVKEWAELTGQDHFDPSDMDTIVSGSIKRGDKMLAWAFKIDDLEIANSHETWMELMLTRQNHRLRDAVKDWEAN